jgi:hypothetical protein
MVSIKKEKKLRLIGLMMLMLLTLGTACCGQFTQVLSCFPFELYNASAFFGGGGQCVP